ncbi:MAG TPA: dihydrodipicolinate synthase family protein [Arachnia sp.]|nr:dihydrodipicolinate synthase family protein [Arachnia sp.]
MVNDLARIFSALVTPTRADESVDHDVLADIVDEQIARGVEGFYCCGSSGEALLLSLEERKAVVSTVTSAIAGRAPVIVHVGTISTTQTIELARHAQAHGAAAVSMIPPYYYAFTSQEIETYYRDVIAAVEVPVMLYNIPQFTGISFSKANTSGLLSDPQVIGMKHTDHNLYSLERLAEAFPDKIFFNGFDEQYLSALVAGATGAVGTTVNIQPELFLRLRSQFTAGDLAGARHTQQQINSVVETLVAHGVFQSTKYIASARGQVTGNCRAPFRPLTDEDRSALDRLVDDIARYTEGDSGGQ